jgi:hypothetical protein
MRLLLLLLPLQSVVYLGVDHSVRGSGGGGNRVRRTYGQFAARHGQVSRSMTRQRQLGVNHFLLPTETQEMHLKKIALQKKKEKKTTFPSIARVGSMVFCVCTYVYFARMRAAAAALNGLYDTVVSTHTQKDCVG